MGIFDKDNLKKSDTFSQWLEDDDVLAESFTNEADSLSHKTIKLPPGDNKPVTAGSDIKPKTLSESFLYLSEAKNTHNSSTTGKKRANGIKTPRNHPGPNVTGVTKSTQDEKPLVSVQITMPKIAIPKPKISRTQVRVVLIVIGVMLLLSAGWLMMNTSVRKHAQKQKNGPRQTVEESLGFVPLRPPKSMDTSARTSYSHQKGFYEYKGVYEGASITINQQPVPEKLRKNASEAEKLARSIGAKDSFSTTLGKVYVSEQENALSQRLMLSNSYMLMFIQSTKPLDNGEWAKYIESFERV